MTGTTYDAIVIGAGAGGGAAAWRLCSKGLRVLVLESGPWFDPFTDYRLHKADWELHGFPQKAGSTGEYSMAPLQKLKAEWNDLRTWNARTGLNNTGTRRFAMGYAHVRGVGGSTLHYQGEAHRMNPHSMDLRSRFGVGADWPMSYGDLEPYYVEAENLLGVAGPEQTGDRWRSAPYPLPPHPLSKSSRYIGEGAKRLGMSWEANPHAVLSQPYDGRPSCNYCGNCFRGCPRRDKGSTDQTFIRHALETGKCEIVARAHVTRLMAGRSKVVRGVEYLDSNGKKKMASAESYWLAAGAIETPRLLLLSRGESAPAGIGNEHGQVGRHFLETVAWTSTAIAPEPLQSYAGLPADGICWDYNRPDSIPGMVGGCRFYSATLDISLSGPVNYAVRIIPGWGSEHKKRMRQTFGSAFSVGAIGESLPHPGSYVDLDPRLKDRFGIPVARIHSYLDDMAVERIRFMANQCRKLIKATGPADIVEEAGTSDTFSSSHVFGTCRMGASPRQAVTNALSQVFNWSNLYIVDGSILPSSGGGESPSLTIQALALRAADGYLK